MDKFIYNIAIILTACVILAAILIVCWFVWFLILVAVDKIERYSINRRITENDKKTMKTADDFHTELDKLQALRDANDYGDR